MKEMMIKYGLDLFMNLILPTLKENAKKTATKWDDLLLEELGHVIQSEAFQDLLKAKV